MKCRTSIFRAALLTAISVASILPAGGRAAESLHERIDARVDARAGGPPAHPSTDAEFLRRAWLDLNGTIPTAAEARQFLADPSPDKRAKLIDRLLESPDYARRMGEAFDVMLMERRTRDDPAAAAWQQYLRASFAANKPWDRLAREILRPDADDESARAAALFYARRLEKVGANPTDYPGLARDVGRLFLGVDLKCAQCHNHVYIKDYKQADFQGLFAFVGQTFIRTDVKFPAVGEKPLLKKIEYVSVFHPADKKETGPRVPFGTECEVPAFEKGQEWAKPPDARSKFPGAPKFSTLDLLAEQVAGAGGELFRRNIANRLWFLMTGRGLVHPLDLRHKNNPASHPELLAMLGDEFATMKFDVKTFVREVALTRAYQRSSLLPEGRDVPAESYRAANVKRMSAEQLARCVLTAAGELEAVSAVKEEAPKPPPAENADAAAADIKPAAKGPASQKEVCRRFAGAFAGPAGEPEVEFAPSVAGALFLSNNPLVLGWLKPRGGNLVDRLAKMPDPTAVADELYLSVLTRLPTDEERSEVKTYLAERPTRRGEAVGELTWALLTSTEFCVNH